MGSPSSDFHKGLLAIFPPSERLGLQVDGWPKASFPKWYFEGHIIALNDELENWKVKLANAKRYDLPDYSGINPEITAKKNIRILENQLASYLSKPKLSARHVDDLVTWRHIITDELTSNVLLKKHSYYGSDSDTNIVKYLNMLSSRWFPVGEYANCYKALGQHEVNGKVSGNSLQVVWKILSGYLGENTNLESIRPDNYGGTYKFERTLYELERDELGSILKK